MLVYPLTAYIDIVNKTLSVLLWLSHSYHTCFKYSLGNAVIKLSQGLIPVFDSIRSLKQGQTHSRYYGGGLTMSHQPNKFHFLKNRDNMVSIMKLFGNLR